MTRWLSLLIAAAAALALPPDVHAQDVGGGLTVFENCGGGNDVALFLGLETDPEKNDRRILRGPVQIHCEDVRLFADELVIDGPMIIATGNVAFSQRDLTVSAERAEIDRTTRRGVFFKAGGIAQLTDRPLEPSMFGTMEPQMLFYGDRIEKTGDRSYKITNGGFSTCVQPTPRWEITGSEASVTLDERIILRHAVLRVKNVPLLYVPFIYYPLGEDDRSTGFLMPSYSTSTLQGTGLSNAFFLVLGRSHDVIFKHTWFSKGGQVYSGRYRFVTAPGSNGEAEITMINQPDVLGEDGLVTQQGERSFTFRARGNQALPGGFRLVGHANYFTDLATEQLYQQNLYRATERKRFFAASLSGPLGPGRLTITGQQEDHFFGFDDAARRGTLPRVSFEVNERIRGSKVYVGLDAETAYLIRQDDLSDPDTNQSLLRIDASPTVRAPLSPLTWLDADVDATWRLTHWAESLDPATELQVPVRLTRNLVDLRANMRGPKLSRVWSPNGSYAQRVKHLIEPEFSLRWLSPFERIDQVVRHDHVDHEVGGTTTLAYGITNEIWIRRPPPAAAVTPGQGAGGPAVAASGDVRRIVSVSLTQSYYSNQLAASVDSAYQSQASGRFSPLRLNVSASPANDVTANFQMEVDAEFRQPRSYTLTGAVNRPQAQVAAGWSRRLVIFGLPDFDDRRATNFLNAAVGVRPFDGRVQSRYEFNFDVRRRALLQQRILFSYSAQCCGVNVDYQTVSFAHLPNLPSRTDRRFGVSFTLAGIGSFSNPLGSFGNNSGR